MARKMRLMIDSIVLTFTLRDTPTATRLWDAAPIEASANTWGEEVYFRTPVGVPKEPDARDVINLGEIAYWPVGNAVAIGFGSTPVSRGNEIRLASPCNVWADSDEPVTALAPVRDGATVRLERIA